MTKQELNQKLLNDLQEKIDELASLQPTEEMKPLLKSCRDLLVVSKLTISHFQSRFNELMDDIASDKMAILCDVGPLEMDGKDWYDTCASGDRLHAGEWLVSHKGWLRHPKGIGRRQFFRPPD